jgi:hypothetical protein
VARQGHWDYRDKLPVLLKAVGVATGVAALPAHHPDVLACRAASAQSDAGAAKEAQPASAASAPESGSITLDDPLGLNIFAGSNDPQAEPAR